MAGKPVDLYVQAVFRIRAPPGAVGAARTACIELRTPEVELDRQLEMDHRAIGGFDYQVQFAQAAALLAYRHVMCDDPDVRRQLQKHLPQTFVVAAQPVVSGLAEFRRQSHGIVIELSESVMQSFGVVAPQTAGERITHRHAAVGEQGWCFGDPGQIATDRLH